MKTVHYADLISINAVLVGSCARLIPLDHPNRRLNGRLSWTSTIEEFIKQTPIGPVFKTRNTKYVPALFDDEGEWDEEASDLAADVA